MCQRARTRSLRAMGGSGDPLRMCGLPTVGGGTAPERLRPRSYKLVMTVLRSLNSKNRWLIPECNVCNVNRSVFRPVRYRFYAYMTSIWYVPSP